MSKFWNIKNYGGAGRGRYYYGGAGRKKQSKNL